MSEFVVRSSVHNYSVTFSERFEDALRERLRPGDIALVDARVADLHASRLRGLLDDPRHLRIAADERVKSYEGAGPVIDHLIRHGLRKDNRILAIGGGVIQDVAGFAASMLFRGVEWICFPTTLLAQCDSCIGSKTSINFGPFKNQLGNFYPPAEVHIDPSFLRTLPEPDLRSGLGEMAHYFLVSGEEDFERFAREAPAALADEALLRALIARSLEIKRGFIEIDEFDRRERQVLNYGHSFGHALETLTDYRLPHGIAVSYGMDMANFVSWKMGLLSEDVRRRVRAALAGIWRGYAIDDVAVPRLLDALRRDKKNAGATLGLILTRGIGHMFKEQVPVTDAFEGWMRDYLSHEVAHG